ncbi:hypothetical protein C2W64_01030 [Brevibacillus laterosporus]|nr:hypothetical protein C2W64_01030 [Brevibacillus laterosporus]
MQPNYGLATYMAKRYAEKELEQALYFEHKQIELIVRGGWLQGNHVEARVSLTFPLLGSGKSYTVEESYSMMIENARN